jgi:hypothetical protein
MENRGRLDFTRRGSMIRYRLAISPPEAVDGQDTTRGRIGWGGAWAGLARAEFETSADVGSGVCEADAPGYFLEGH